MQKPDDEFKVVLLRGKIKTTLQIPDHNWSERELDNLLHSVLQHPTEKRTADLWQSLASKISGKPRLINEAIDVSDLNYLLDQIQDILKKQ